MRRLYRPNGKGCGNGVFRSDRAPGVERRNAERMAKGLADCATETASLAEEVGLGRIVLRRKAPAIGTVNDEAPFLKGLQRLAETGIVDAK